LLSPQAERIEACQGNKPEDDGMGLQTQGGVQPGS